GQTRTAGLVLLVAGLLDLLDGSLARASGQVTAFGAFLDSVIDRYSDIAVMLGIVVLYARTPNPRGALVAMAGLAGSVMVSYTKARAESIGVECNVGMMERPERLICLIAGAVLDVMEPALWVLAVLANLTAVQRIVFTRRMMRAEPRRARVLLPLLAAALLLPADVDASAETERAWARAVAAFQDGEPHRRPRALHSRGRARPRRRRRRRADRGAQRRRPSSRQPAGAARARAGLRARLARGRRGRRAGGAAAPARALSRRPRGARGA